MKKLHLLGMAAVFAVAFASCGSEKQMTNQTPAPQPQKIQEGVSVTLPCLDSSYDNDDYYRDLGIGTDLNPQMARKAAVKAAQSMGKERLESLKDFQPTIAVAFLVKHHQIKCKVLLRPNSTQLLIKC